MASKNHREENEPVTKGYCRVRHKNLSRQLWAVFSTLGLFVAVFSLFGVAIGWSWDAADSAEESADKAEAAATEVRRQFDIHDAKQGAVMGHIGETLERIEEDVREQRKLVEQIHRNGRK